MKVRKHVLDFGIVRSWVVELLHSDEFIEQGIKPFLSLSDLEFYEFDPNQLSLNLLGLPWRFWTLAEIDFYLYLNHNAELFPALKPTANIFDFPEINRSEIWE